MNPGFWSHRQMIAHPPPTEDRIRLTAVDVLLKCFFVFHISIRAGSRRRDGAGGERLALCPPRRKQSGDVEKMAKYAILSDIHANYDALKVVLEKCRELEVDHYVSLGDIVGYNADPQICVRTIYELNCIARVRGNHDEYTANGDIEISGFNPHAKKAVEWTRAHLDEAERNWIGSAPFRTTMQNCNTTLVHATLDSPENWGYIFDAHHAADNFNYQFTSLCFCGHSHVPVAFCKKPVSSHIEEIEEWNYNPELEDDNFDYTLADELPVEIKVGYKYLFNIGSIGQPRNRDPRASFAVLDTVARYVTRYRLPYDIASQQQKIIDAGLPERLATRLELGS